MLDCWLDDLKVRRDVEIPWGEEAVVPDVEGFYVTLPACRILRVSENNFRQNRVAN